MDRVEPLVLSNIVGLFVGRVVISIVEEEGKGHHVVYAVMTPWITVVTVDKLCTNVVEEVPLEDVMVVKITWSDELDRIFVCETGAGILDESFEDTAIVLETVEEGAKLAKGHQVV